MFSYSKKNHYLHLKHSVHPAPFLQGVGGWYSDQIFKKEGLERPQLLEGVAGKEGVTFFREGRYFEIKNKLKSDMFNDKKKFINKNAFFCHN